MYGKKIPIEVIEKIKNTKKEKYYRKVICLENKMVFESIADAGRKMNLERSNIGLCCQKRAISTKGYHFMYYEDYINDFGKTKFYCLNDTEETIKLYRLINQPTEISSIKPNHISGKKLYDDGFEWEFLQSFDINNYDKRSTVEHVAVNLEIGKKIKSQILFISTDFKNPIPTKSTIVSLVINPLNLNMKPLTSDFEWYAHRINFGNVKEGSFYLNDDTNYNGNVVFFDSKKTGYIVSNKDFNKIKFSRLTFTDNDTYPIKKLIPSQVKRNSGYTIFMQKFKPMFVYKQLKFVISIKEE
jgi:hypothetical protein